MPSASYAVIGLGLFGSAIARTLASMGHDVLGIDMRLPEVEAVGRELTEAAQADATDRAVLASLHLDRYDLVFVTIGDLSSSILCTLALREQGVRRIVAKINSPQQGRILTRLGAEDVLFPERDMGERIARQIGSASSSITSQIDLARDASILEIVAPPALAGRTLAEAELRKRYGVTVVAIKPRSRGRELAGAVLVSPPADTRVGAHDIVLVAGRNDDLERLQQSNSQSGGGGRDGIGPHR